MIATMKQTAAKDEFPISRSAMTSTANGSGNPIATLSKAQKMLQTAETIEEIQYVENLAELARGFVKKRGSGGSRSMPRATCSDARRKVGKTLKAMRQRGELADGRKPKPRQSAKQSHAAIVYTLSDLGLSNSQSSLYQQEASVPPDAYEAWVQRIVGSKERVLERQGPSCPGAAIERV